MAQLAKLLVTSTGAEFQETADGSIVVITNKEKGQYVKLSPADVVKVKEWIGDIG